ncbi:MAG TPA: hypothetical protein VK465_07895 [Fibrobacteria bacterium]|nr:hypothetical protein [Fibrobacteria bacterium]
MGDRRIIKRIKLKPFNAPTGNTRHFLGQTELAPPSELVIVQYPEDPGFYLLYLDTDGEELTDTYHETLEKALDQAEWEFGVKPADWVSE